MKSHIAGVVLHTLLAITLAKGDITPTTSTGKDTEAESTSAIMTNLESVSSSVYIEPTQTVDVTSSMAVMETSRNVMVSMVDNSSESIIATPSIDGSEMMPNFTSNIQTSNVLIMTSSITSDQITASIDATTAMAVVSSTDIPEWDLQNSSSAIIMESVTQTLSENTVTITVDSITTFPIMSSGSVSMSEGVVSSMYVPESIVPTSVFDSSQNSSNLMSSYAPSMPMSTSVMTTMIDEYSSQSIFQPSSAQPPEMTSSATPATTKAPVPKTTPAATAPRPGDKENAVFAVRGNVEMEECVAGQSEKETLTDWFKDVLGFQSVRVINSALNCQSTRRKRDTNTGKPVEYEVRLLANVALDNSEEIQSVINKTLNDLKTNGTILDHSNFLSNFQKAIKSDFCGAEGYCDQGFKCSGDKNDSQCYSWCDKKFGISCKNDGVCVVEFDFNAKGFKTKCRCTSTEYYSYEGDDCDTEKMTWRLIVAITGGVAGAIIIILLFIIIIVCLRSKRNNYDSEDYTPINDEVRMQNYKEKRRSDVHNYMRPDFQPFHEQQVYDNKAYDMPDNDSDMVYRQNPSSTDGHGKNWDPAQSANIYAKLNSTFEDGSFQNNIKRPRVSSTKTNADGVTGF